MAKLGYVGLGTMGGLMTERLLSKDHTVVGYNRTKSKAQWLVEKGLQLADSPREVAEQVDIVLSMVTDTKAVEAITQGPDGILAGLSEGKVYIDMSTMSPNYSRELAEQVKATGARMLDAPVSGSVVTLLEGKLSLMVGGEKEIFEKALPILQDIGPKVTHVGGNGLAVSMKIATNLGLAVQMLAFSEAVLLAEKAGIARETAVDVLVNSVIASPMVKYRGPFVLGHPEEAWFNCSMMQKDMNLAIELGKQLKVPLPTTAATNEYLTAAIATGIGNYDFAIMFDVLARTAGIDESTLAR
ncbi:MAG: NAD(P)-dependent oxidoreductase [Desulfatiglandales bacterium]